MKKIISRVLCIAMILSLLLTFAACGASGTYSLEKVSYGGVSLDAEAAGFEDGKFYIELSSNGTAVMCFNGEKEDMEWEDGQIWAVDEPDGKVPFELDDDELIIEIEGVEMVFVKD